MKEQMNEWIKEWLNDLSEFERSESAKNEINEQINVNLFDMKEGIVIGENQTNPLST